MERVLITGALGQLGIEFIKYFEKNNIYVLATDIKFPSKKLSCDFEIADALDKESLDFLVKKNKINTIYHLVAVLSATEEVLDSVPSSLDAAELTKLAKEENLTADVFGPLAFDNSISKKSAGIKGIKNIVAGEADVLLVPSVETGNALVKMLIYFGGACAAGVVVGGKVPVVITSRSDEAPARLASIAAAVVALD